MNLLGSLYFTHVALAAMRYNRGAQGSNEKSITLVSSIAGFKESPGLFAYSASKHGVMGIMRSLRGLLSTFNTRINVICPWATDTGMLSGVRDIWTQSLLPMNTPEAVARIILQCTADYAIHGNAVFVADGVGFDIEEGLDRTEPQWLGEKQSRVLAEGQAALGTVSISRLKITPCHVPALMEIIFREVHGLNKTTLMGRCHVAYMLAISDKVAWDPFLVDNLGHVHDKKFIGR